MYILLLLWEKR